MFLKRILFVMVGITIISCSYDSDYYPLFNEGNDWITTFGEIVSDNKELLETRNMEIVGAKKIEDLKVNKALFYSGEYGFFPVFSDGDSVYTVVSYDELINNAEKYNFNKEKVDSKISEYLEKADDYEIVEITWKFKTEMFKSLALFNKRTGELEYDNMLFNMSTIAKYDAKGFSRLLSQFEGELLFSESDYVEYIVNNELLAKAGVTWSVYVGWEHFSTMTEDQFYYYITNFSYSYLNYLSISPISYYAHSSGSDIFIQYANRSVTYEPRYALDYAIWAGPSNGFNSYNFNLSEPELSFYARFSSGVGKIIRYQNSLPTKYEYLVVPKN